jgi:Zn-dependent protease with chaperone function
MEAGASHPSPGTAPRGEARRRLLLLAVCALLLLSVGPVFGHHFAEGLEHALRGRDHLGALCLIALHEILRPVHLLFHALVMGGLVYAGWDRARAARRMRRVLTALDARVPAPGDAFWEAAVAAGTDPRRVRVVPGLPSPAFTAGWLRPRIYAAESLAERLSGEELAAVLAHEGAHAARRDPLRLSALRFLALTLFWLPALRRLADDVADEAEVRADDRAARGRPLALASAILALAGWRRLPDGVGFAQRADLLDRRVRRLAGENPPAASHVTRRSLLGAALALALAWTSGAIMAHPLPADDAGHPALHCDHPGLAALTHLFCFPASHGADRGVCPHLRRT